MKTLLKLAIICICSTAFTQTNVSSKISASSEDTEERLTDGFITITSADLDFQPDTSIGMHFKNLNIPAGATINNAYIQFTADEARSGAVTLDIYAEAANNPQIWTSTSGDVSARTSTTAVVQWSPADWITVGDALAAQQTPDISAIIQELVNRVGYSSSDAINIIITINSGTGVRNAETYDGNVPASAPELFVTYTASDTQAPTAPALSSNSQTDTSVSLSWTAATDDTAVTSYKVYKDAVLEATLGNVLDYPVTGLTASTAYNFTVTALDAAGNESVVSNTVAITTDAARSGNLLDTSTWTVGTGSAPGFTRYGTDAENVREMGTGPHGTSVLLWKAVPDATTGLSGGWLADYMGIDHTKTYRITSWIKRTGSTNGGTYQAFFCKDGNNAHAALNLNGNVNGAPYQFSGDPPQLDEWYLVVTYIHPSDYASQTVIGDLYNTNGEAQGAYIQNHKFSDRATTIAHRLYLSSFGDVTERQYLYDPAIYEVNGQEPSIQDLIDGPPDTQDPTAPTLSSTAQTDTTVDLSWTGATDNVAVTGYKVYKDAVLETTLGAVTTYQVTGLTASTAYNFTVTALDAVGNESVVSNTVAITTDAASDTQAPTAPTLSSNSQTDTSVSLSWTAATDNTAVTGYKVYKDAILEATLGNVLDFPVTGLTAATTYNFTVTALDAAGNESVVSNTAAITTDAIRSGSLLDTSIWTAGTGSVTGFNRIGSDAENVREMGTGPHGSSVLLWKTVSGDTDVNAGGWNTDYLAVDHTKSYRFTTWVRGEVSNDGSVYFGVTALDASGNSSTNYLSGNPTGSAFMWIGDPPTLNNWYLLVGFVYGSGHTDITVYGGVYDINGVKVASASNDFKLQASTIEMRQRLWLGAVNDAGNIRYYYDPAIYEINGQEPTIQELIDGPSDTEDPTAPTLSSTAQTDTTVDLSWTGATDNTAVTSYKVYKDAVLETTLGNVSTYQVTGLTASTAYNFTVTALDAAGNESVVSNTVAITTNAASSYDAAYQAILDEATTQGYTLPSSADQDIQNQIVVSAKASGIWASADLILYFKGSGDKDFKLINWKDPAGTKATEEDFGGALTWSSTGVKGDGINLIDTNFDPSAGSLNYTQNNAGVYAKVSTAFTTKFNLFGGSNLSLSTEVQRPNINSDGSLAPVFTFPTTGLLGVSRNNASSFIASVGTTLTTLTHASGSVSSEDIKILGYGTVLTSNFTRFDGEVAYVIMGEDMSANLPDIETAFDASGDTQDPTAPTLSSTAQTDTTVDLSWTGATDNVAVTGYRVYKDAVLETTLGAVTTYQVTELTASTAYNFTVAALDAAGNESVISNTVAITTDAAPGGGQSLWSINNQDIYYNNGNVGIGTDSPDAKLAVNGTIHSKEVRVDLNNWPDYVFTGTYNLPTLKEIEDHIKAKGHLPNMPSAEDVESNGVLLGYMNAKLLEKIEELTLYTIKQHNVITSQKEKSKALQERLAKLEQLVKKLTK